MRQPKLKQIPEANVRTAIGFVISWAVRPPILAALAYSVGTGRTLGTTYDDRVVPIVRAHLICCAFKSQFLETNVRVIPSFAPHIKHDGSLMRGLFVPAHNFFQPLLRNLESSRRKFANPKHPINSFFFRFSSVRAVRHKAREVSKLCSKSEPHAQMFRYHRFKDKQSRKVRLNRWCSLTSKKGQVPSPVFTRGKVFHNAGAAQLICHRSITSSGSSNFMEKIVTKQAPLFGAQKHFTSMSRFGSAIGGDAQSPNRYADQYCNNDRSPVGGISVIEGEGAKHVVILSCMNSSSNCATLAPIAGGSANIRPFDIPVFFGKAAGGYRASNIPQVNSMLIVLRNARACLETFGCKSELPPTEQKMFGQIDESLAALAYARPTVPSYSGWNKTPSSTAELFADGLTHALRAAAFAFMHREPIRIEIRKVWPAGGCPAHAEREDG